MITVNKGQAFLIDENDTIDVILTQLTQWYCANEDNLVSEGYTIWKDKKEVAMAYLNGQREFKSYHQSKDYHPSECIMVEYSTFAPNDLDDRIHQWLAKQ